MIFIKHLFIDYFSVEYTVAVTGDLSAAKTSMWLHALTQKNHQAMETL
ncbi:MAG: hypothetical protein Q7R66_18005 [Undibacterium sp.]|nr:hypothetical protein [Undibacterium sp.]MDO8654070.1 hypothetical protein [Undibacterium sp.]